MIKISSGVVDAMLNNTGLTQALNDAGLRLCIFSGPVPNLPDDAIPSTATLLVEVGGGDGTGDLYFTYAPGERLLLKDPNQAWRGTVASGGTPSFYRLMSSGDTGGSNTAVRIQGTVGNTGDLKLAATVLETGKPQTVEYYQLWLPRFIGE